MNRFMNRPIKARPIRVLICDDHAVLRAGLRALLALQPDLQVVGEAGDADSAVAAASDLHPDVILMDLAMPGGGVAATRRIAAGTAGARVLVLSQYDDEGYLQQALAAGAAGYALKRAADVELLAAVRAVAAGDVYLHPSLARALIQRFLPGIPGVAPAERLRQRPVGCGEVPAGAPGDPPIHATCGPPLSERETQVLRLLAQGHTNQQVADRLALSVKTVEAYKARLSDKLGLRGRAALFRYALDHGLLAGA